jgi:hypothetical protein
MKSASKSVQKRLAVQRKPVVRRKPHAIVKTEPPTVAEAIEKVLITGDLTPLTPEQRVQYYKAVCQSLGLNPLTNPFMYILFREFDGSPAKLQLYATKSCSEQLRKIHGVSVIPNSERRVIENGERCIVDLALVDRTGRTDTGQGVVALYKFKDGKRLDLTAREYDNAIMKTHTKAKRRGTLSICGLAFLDESELDHVQVIGGVTRDGRIYQFADTEPQQPRQLSENAAHGHAPGSEKAKQAEAAIARCEEEDRKLKESGGANSKPKETPLAAAEGSAPPAGELFVVQAGELFEISGPIAAMNEHRGLLLHYGKRKDKSVVMDAEQLNQFTYQFVDLRKGKLTKRREPGAEG